MSYDYLKRKYVNREKTRTIKYKIWYMNKDAENATNGPINLDMNPPQLPLFSSPLLPLPMPPSLLTYPLIPIFYH